MVHIEDEQRYILWVAYIHVQVGVWTVCMHSKNTSLNSVGLDAAYVIHIHSLSCAPASDPSGEQPLLLYTIKLK